MDQVYSCGLKDGKIYIWLIKTIIKITKKMESHEIEEKIICAAIWYKDFPLIRDSEIPDGFIRPLNCDRGIVFSGCRHDNCMYQMVAITGKYSHQIGEYIQGFLTSKNRFVNRNEGLEIALKMNQVIDLDDVRGKELYSENLY
jgi:hypothetical protein